MRHAAEILHVRIHFPCPGKRFVSQVVNPLQEQTAHHKAYGHRGTAGPGIIARKLSFKMNPFHLVGQENQFVISVNEIK